MNIIDSHIHFWDPRQLTYSWLDYVPTLKQPMLPKDLSVAAPQLTGGIFIQSDCDPEQALQEVEWVTSLIKQNNPISILGIVAYVALEDGNQIINNLNKLKDNPYVVGVRRSIQNEKSNLWLSDNYLAGILLTSSYGLTIDMCVRHHQLQDLYKLLKNVYKEDPHVRIIIDHLGKPDIKNGQFQQWQHDISKISEFPNVYCKLSGAITEADWQHWQDSEITPYIKHAIGAFGHERCLFGGDWPVVNLAGDYQRWLNCLCSALSDLEVQSHESVFYKNAIYVYVIK